MMTELRRCADLSAELDARMDTLRGKVGCSKESQQELMKKQLNLSAALTIAESPNYEE